MKISKTTRERLVIESHDTFKNLILGYQKCRTLRSKPMNLMTILLYQGKEDLHQNQLNGDNLKNSEILISEKQTDSILYIIILMITLKKYVEWSRTIWKITFIK